GRERDQFRRVFADAVGITRGPSVVNLHVAPGGPAPFLQSLQERRVACLGFRIVCGERGEHCDAPHALSLLLRPRRKRPSRRAAEQRDERAPFHSITSSARASTLAGTSMPSAFAVLRLIANSYFVGFCIGRSAGGSPLRMRSMYPAARRYGSVVSAP